MPKVNLEIPVLVSPSKDNYHLRPLFLENPLSSAKRFRDAMDLLAKEVRRYFRSFYTERDSIDDLLWMTFNPKLKFEFQKLYFSLGQHMIFGKFIVIRFSLKQHQFVFLPAFNKFAIISSNILEHGDFVEQLIIIVSDEMQLLKRKQDSFSPNDYYALGGEFLTTLNVSINVKRAEFPFENTFKNWFASLSNQQQKFSGGSEITRVGSNLFDKYPNKLQRALLRDVEVEALSNLIFSEKLTAVVIIGSPGSGRTSLLHECFYRYLQKTKPKTTIWHLDPNRIIAGMSIVGMWQRRFESILEYIIKPLPEKRPRLFIDNIVALFRIGKSAQNSLTLSDVLKPYLERQTLTFIAEASQEEWNIVMETDRRFADLCQVFRLNELNTTDTASVALLERSRLEQLHNSKIDNEAIERIFALTDSLLRGSAKPGNIVNFMERLAVRHNQVGIAEVEAAVNEISHINREFLNNQHTLFAEKVQQSLAAKLIGQTEAIDCLVNVVQTIKAGVQDPKKPMATLLFIGPTGVGKTQAAKVLTRYLFTDESQLIRFDMNEYVTDADVGRLIGDWRKPEGLLTTQIRHQPFCVLLLDEIEKAHSKIHDLLLQVLGEGRLTDALGRTTDFTNTIIILTSNLGAEQATRSLGFIDKTAQQSSTYRAAVEDFFRPELLNRIDRLVPFNSLNLKDAIAITKIQLNDLLQRDGFVRRTTILNISESALKQVTLRGFDSLLGGRALKRAIERDLTALAAKQLVKLQATQPIILDIDWRHEHLEPKITALIANSNNKQISFPQIPSIDIVTEKLNLVIDLREQLYVLRTENNIELSNSTEEMRFILSLQESLFELKEQLDELLWNMETARDFTEIRFASTKQNPINEYCWRHSQMNAADLYAHQDILDYLEEIYVIAPKLIQELNSNWVSLIMKIKFSEFFCQQLNNQQQIILNLQSRVYASGDKELNYLLNAYEETLIYLGIETTRIDNQLHIKGPGIESLLANEIGIHLFHLANQNAIPIQVSFMKNDDIDDQEELPIIRSYALGDDKKTGVLTDFKTGMLNKTSLNAHEWALIWYFGSNKG
jgi:ATP-dependent Clp protease ATP-binding subunit ClpC